MMNAARDDALERGGVGLDDPDVGGWQAAGEPALQQRAAHLAAADQQQRSPELHCCRCLMVALASWLHRRRLRLRRRSPASRSRGPPAPLCRPTPPSPPPDRFWRIPPPPPPPTSRVARKTDDSGTSG